MRILELETITIREAIESFPELLNELVTFGYKSSVRTPMASCEEVTLQFVGDNNYRTKPLHNREDFAQRLAKIDGRPYHPEDYREDLDILLQNGLPKHIITKRLSYLEDNPAKVTGFIACVDFLRTGVLRDGCTYEILYQEMEI